MTKFECVNLNSKDVNSDGPAKFDVWLNSAQIVSITRGTDVYAGYIMIKTTRGDYLSCEVLDMVLQKAQ